MDELNKKIVEMLTNEEPELQYYAKQVSQDANIKLEQEELKKQNQQYKKEFGDYQGEDRVVPSKILKDYYKKYTKKPQLIYSEIKQLDNIITGFEEGELVVISGITGNGKTLFAKTLTYNFAIQSIGVLFFTYEEQPKIFLDRFEEDYFPGFFLPNKHLTGSLSWIEKRIIEAKIKYKIQIVFIDHLHFLVPLQAYNNTSLLVGGIMRELKKLALKHEIIIFLLAHTSKIKQNEVPDLSNLRDSSFVAQEADKVFIVRRKGEIENDEIVFTDMSDIYILKNRMTGQLGKVIMRYDYITKYLIENT